jgi:hypothetical protein
MEWTETEQKLIDELKLPMKYPPNVLLHIIEWYGGHFEKWIDVRDRMHVYKQCVLFLTQDKKILSGCYVGLDSEEQPYFKDEFQEHYYTITHWMRQPPLPHENIKE